MSREFFVVVPHQLGHGPTLYNGHLVTHDTYTCCRAFGSGAVTTSGNDLGLSLPGSNPDLPN